MIRIFKKPLLSILSRRIVQPPLRRWINLCLLCLWPLLLGLPAAQAAGGHIEGRIALTLPDGSVHYGDWIRVFLVREKVDIAPLKDLSHLEKHARIERLISAHVDFFKKVMDKMDDPNYIVAETLTTPDGTFKFYGLVPGRYFVLVTLPSMIYGYKVAWQVSAAVTEGKTLRLELKNDNLAVPTYAR